MKNHRDVCMAREAGFVSFQGLPGHIKTGCLLTPELKSRYCSLHTPRVCRRTEDENASTNDPLSDDIAEMILEKKVTRSTTFYKVCTGVCLTILFHTCLYMYVSVEVNGPFV